VSTALCTTLSAGAARVDATPPLGLDIVGFLRRWRPAEEYGFPFEVNALVLEADGSRQAIVALDIGSTPEPFAARLREAVALAAGCKPDAVLVNCSHTHSAPPTPGYIKTGGSTATLREPESRYAEELIELAASAAKTAADRLAPAAIGLGTDSFDGGVNRRQRTPDGGTIMGWNPDAPADQEVLVLRVDRLDGGPIATVVNYACHPTVLGTGLYRVCTDYPGPMRARVREIVGGECMFLQGCAGNMFPLEAVFDEPGPEVVFGRRLALAAVRARDRAEAQATAPQESRGHSAVPFAIWRREVAEDQPSADLRAFDIDLSLPLKDPPSRDELEAIKAEIAADLEDRKARGLERGEWNPVWLHLLWAEEMLEREAGPGLEGEIDFGVHVQRIGPLTIVGLPCEPFCEIGLDLKHRLGAGTLTLGYTNGMAGYLPSAEEFQYGGYEPTLGQRHFGKPAPFAEDAAGQLVDSIVERIESQRPEMV
jgi:neutral ceramidase